MANNIEFKIVRLVNYDVPKKWSKSKETTCGGDCAEQKSELHVFWYRLDEKKTHVQNIGTEQMAKNQPKLKWREKHITDVVQQQKRQDKLVFHLSN